MSELWVLLEGMVTGFSIALILRLFASSWVRVEHDNDSLYGRVIYKGIPYNLTPADIENTIDKTHTIGYT